MITKVLEKSAKQKKTNYFKHPLDLIFERSKKHGLKKDNKGKLKTAGGVSELSDDTQ
jgi:hypothetical protein|tara:strand:+ start:1262 stop:1432 length:171 start_codon:yes stop_codon:yes gene_type:complete